MARSRNIKPGFFKNDELAECDPLSRILFAGLWTLADREGRFEFRTKKIKAECLPYDECDIEELLRQLEHRGFFFRYGDGGEFAQIANWHKHQKPHHKETESEIPPPPANYARHKTKVDNDLPCTGHAQVMDDSSKTLGRSMENASCLTDSLNLIPDSLNLDSLNSMSACADEPQPASETTTANSPELEAERLFVEAWNSKEGTKKSRSHMLTASRRKAFRARCRDPMWDWQAALDKFPLKCFSDPNQWQPNLDWFLRPDIVTSILEGKYDWSKDDRKQSHHDASYKPTGRQETF